MFCACEKEIDILLSPKEKKIVINSFFNDEEFMHVNISSNQPSTDGDTVHFIDNACVLLYSYDVFLDTLLLNTDGDYVSDKVIPEINIPYKLKVEVPGLTTATTDFSRIPVAVKYLSLDTSSYVDNISGREFRHVKIRFKDIENTPNYYLLYMIWVGTRYEYDADSTITDSSKTKAAYGWGDGINIPRSGKLLFSDELVENDTIEKNLYFRKDMYGSGLGGSDNLKAYFKLCTVSEEYYLYGKSYAEQNFGIDYSMLVEPVPVYSNVNNGEGIFAGYGQCIDSVFYEK